MSGTKDSNLTDLEQAQLYWERIKSRMEWCRNKATEYLKTHPRVKNYRISYVIDSDEKTTYAPLFEDDIKLIQGIIEQDVAEFGPFKNEEDKANVLRDILSDLDICWDSYLSFDELNLASEYPPRLTGVDFDDYKYYCFFKVMKTRPYDSEPERLYNNLYRIEMSNDIFVDLVAAKLFDNKLSFYDLDILYEDIYKRIVDVCYTPHQSYVIFMKEINEVAQVILDSKAEEERPEPIRGYYKSIGTIFNNQDQFNDKFLLKCLHLAIQN